LLLLLTGACASSPDRPVEFAFALMGDAPYSNAQVHLLEDVIRRINAEPLSFAVHVGDITSGRGPCDDAWLEARMRQFAKLRVPFVLLPGDNEWTDCHRSGFEPLERLAKWRALFCFRQPEIGLERQGGEYCENVRWQAGDLLFVGLNIPGSNNNLGRTAAMDAEHARRMQETLAWLEAGVALARARSVSSLVILFHANPFQAPRAGRPDGYAGIRERLRELAARARPRTVLVHGDTHTFRDDEPLPGLRRIEVFGAPHVRWLRAGAAGGEIRVDPAD
jgi:hypothetical protein